jgi:Arc/MetJ family transcription regulator
LAGPCPVHSLRELLKPLAHSERKEFADPVSSSFQTHNLLTCIYESAILYISVSEVPMAVTMTSIRLDTDLADEAVRVLKAKSRTDAVHIALREIVGLKRFKALMKKNSGKLKFSGLDE